MNDSYKLKHMLNIIMIYFNRIYVRKKKSPKKEYGASLKKNPRKVDEEQIIKGFIRLYIIHTCINIHKKNMVGFPYLISRFTRN